MTREQALREALEARLDHMEKYAETMFLELKLAGYLIAIKDLRKVLEEVAVTAFEPDEKEIAMLDDPETWKGIGAELGSATVAAGPALASADSESQTQVAEPKRCRR